MQRDISYQLKQGYNRFNVMTKFNFSWLENLSLEKLTLIYTIFKKSLKQCFKLYKRSKNFFDPRIYYRDGFWIKSIFEIRFQFTEFTSKTTIFI
jgi:hypothetical protein